MAITKRSSSTLTSGSRTNSTVPAPAGSATGDYIVVALLVGNSASVVPATPAGWTLLGSVAYSAPDPWTVNLRLYGRFFDGAGSWVWTHAAATSQAFASAYTGVDPATPLDVTAATASQNQVAVDGPPAAVAPSVTIVTANVMELIARGSWDGNAITPPAGWTEEHDTPVLWVGDRIQASTGATGTIDVPHGNGGPNPDRLPWGIIHAALRPSSGTSPVTGGISTSTPTVTVAVPTLQWSGAAAVPVFAGTIGADTPTTTVNAPSVEWAGQSTVPVFAGDLDAATPVVSVGVPAVQWSGSVTEPDATTGALSADTPDVTVAVPSVSWSGAVTVPVFAGSIAAGTPAVTVGVPSTTWTGATTAPEHTGNLDAETPALAVGAPVVEWSGGVTAPTSGVLVTTLPTVAVGAPLMAWTAAPSRQRDITVTGTLGPTRWAGALHITTRTGTIRRRWKGTT